MPSGQLRRAPSHSCRKLEIGERREGWRHFVPGSVAQCEGPCCKASELCLSITYVKRFQRTCQEHSPPSNSILKSQTIEKAHVAKMEIILQMHECRMNIWQFHNNSRLMFWFPSCVRASPRLSVWRHYWMSQTSASCSTKLWKRPCSVKGSYGNLVVLFQS